jgi:hypothetical protein
MEERLTRPPQGIELGALSLRVFEILADYTVFPWPVLTAQATRIGVDAQNLTREDLGRLGPKLAEGVARFTSPEKGAAVLKRLGELR